MKSKIILGAIIGVIVLWLLLLAVVVFGVLLERYPRTTFVVTITLIGASVGVLTVLTPEIPEAIARPQITQSSPSPSSGPESPQKR